MLAPLRTLDEPVVWGGQAYHHFGHQIADFGTRILQSATERRNDPFLFLKEPTQAPPGFFYDIMDWLGLARGRIRFVEEPIRARELHVAAQAEQLPNGGPCGAYLDLLDRNWRDKQLSPVAARVVYVSRSALTTKGCHAGEEYLCSVLEQLGVSVIRPETMPLEEQMRRYAGAATLVFAEGSALHGRQLLGRLDQDIVVLNRRPRTRIGWASLMPRCRRLAYAEVSLEPVTTYWKDGREHSGRAISIYDVDILFAAFRSVGVDLGRRWRPAVYAQSRDAAIRQWLSVQLRNPAIDVEKSAQCIEQRLRGRDLRHLLRFLRVRADAARIKAMRG
jgi:hypothetical protein